VKRLILIAPLALIGMALFVLIGGQLVRFLWNWLIPPIFGWPQIDFWQAIGLLALCRILFGGFGLRDSGRSRWRHRMDERWEQMTPEQRERFREVMNARQEGRPAAADSNE
jgi:hypothetical protein